MNKERRKVVAQSVSALRAVLEDVTPTLADARDAEQEYVDNMPEGLQGSERGEQAQEAAGLLSDVVDALEALSEQIEQLDAI